MVGSHTKNFNFFCFWHSIGLEQGAEISPYGSFQKPKKGQLATSIACPVLTALTGLWLPAGTHQRPTQGDQWTSPEDSLDWAQSCHSHSGMAVRHPDGSVREHSLPTTLGRQARDSLAAFLVPGRATRGCLRGRCRVLTQAPKEPCHPSQTMPPLSNRLHSAMAKFVNR